MTTYFLPKAMASPYTSPSPPQFPMERKLKKPLMEKRRRARMNECLDQLKHLLLHISPNHRTKLEKADILEMTVAYLNQIQHSPSPSTSFDNCAIYQRSYTEGFTVAATACLAYLQNTLPPGEFAPYSQQFRIGLMQHLQSVMSNQVKPPDEDSPGPIPPHPAAPCIPANFPIRPTMTGNYPPMANFPPSNVTYPCAPYVSYPPNMPTTSVIPAQAIAAPAPVPGPTGISCTPKVPISRPVAVVGAQTPLSSRQNNGEKEQKRRPEAVNGKANEDKELVIGSEEAAETPKRTKVWRPF